MVDIKEMMIENGMMIEIGAGLEVMKSEGEGMMFETVAVLKKFESEMVMFEIEAVLEVKKSQSEKVLIGDMDPAIHTAIEEVILDGLLARRLNWNPFCFIRR